MSDECASKLEEPIRFDVLVPALLSMPEVPEDEAMVFPEPIDAPKGKPSK